MSDALNLAWYAEIDGKPEGPFDEFEIGEHFYDGTLNAESLVWNEGMAEWAMLKSTKLKNLIDSVESASPVMADYEEPVVMPPLPQHQAPEPPQAAASPYVPTENPRNEKPPSGNHVAYLALALGAFSMVMPWLPLQIMLFLLGFLAANKAYTAAAEIEEIHYRNGHDGTASSGRLLTTIAMGFFLTIFLLTIIGLIFGAQPIRF